MAHVEAIHTCGSTCCVGLTHSNQIFWREGASAFQVIDGLLAGLRRVGLRVPKLTEPSPLRLEERKRVREGEPFGRERGGRDPRLQLLGPTMGIPTSLVDAV
eukprot:5871596-Pyramimonas_sp.AAC.1